MYFFEIHKTSKTWIYRAFQMMASHGQIMQKWMMAWENDHDLILEMLTNYSVSWSPKFCCTVQSIHLSHYVVFVQPPSLVSQLHPIPPVTFISNPSLFLPSFFPCYVCETCGLLHSTPLVYAILTISPIYLHTSYNSTPVSLHLPPFPLHTIHVLPSSHFFTLEWV